MAGVGTKVGTGLVSIEPDWTGFQPAVERGVKARFQKIGDDAGRALTESVNKRVRRDRSGFGLAASLAPIVERFKKTGEDAGKAFSRGVSRGAPSELSSIAKAMQKAGVSLERSAESGARAMRSLESDTFGVGRAAKRAGADLLAARGALASVGSETHSTHRATRSLTGRLRSLGAELRASRRDARAAGGGFGGINGAMARVNRGFSFFKNLLRTVKWPVFLAGLGLSLQGLSALAAGAVAGAGSLGRLSGALVVLPALALAAAQAFSVLKLATAGIGDALKAGLDAEIQGGQQAVDTMRQQEDAAERVADAKRNLTSVQKQALVAQEDLTQAREDARRELEDMRLASEASHDAEQQGSLSLIQARKDLARTLRDADSSGLDIRFAEEAVDQARNDLESTRVEAKRTREDYRDAKKAGVDGMPSVVAAKQAEADANQAVTDANRDLEKAVRDSTDAMKEQGSAASAFRDKMSQLPPAAQKFVRVLLSMKPRLDELRSTAASRFFPGAESGLKGLMGNFREVKAVVADTAGALGKIAAKAGKKLGSDVWGKDLSRLGKLNTRILGRMGDATLNLADALRHVLVAAEPFLDWMSEGAVKLSEWVKGEAAAGRESGKLAAFFDRTRQTMELLGPILKGVGGALLNIGEAARPLGNAILSALGDSAEGWRKWTDSTKGENTLKRYFAEVKPAVFEMGKLIGAIGKAFFTLGKQEGVAHLLRLVRTELIPALTDVTGAVTGWASDFLTEFGEMRDRGVPTFDAFTATLAKHAGEAGLKIAKALWNAFVNAGALGKITIAGLILQKTGGLKKLAGLGWDMGTTLGKNLFKAAAKWIAGTEAGGSLLGWFQGTFSKGGRFGKAAGTAGSRMGRLLGRGMVIGLIAGLALFREDIEKAIDKHIIDPVKDKLDDLPGPLGAVSDALDAAWSNRDLVDPANLGPVPTALGLDVKGSVKGLYDDILGTEIPAPKTDKARAAFESFRKHAVQQGLLTRQGLRAHLEPLPGIAEGSGRGILRQMLPRLDALKTEGGKKGDAFAKRLGGSFGSATGAATTAMETLGFNVREMLKVLGGDQPKFNLKKALGSLPELKPMGNQLKPIGRQTGGLVPAFATGGLASMVPGNSTGDRHTLSLNGTPVAKVESKEGIFVGNRNLMSAMQEANARVPRFQKGGLVDGAVQRLRRGGLVEPKLAGDSGSLKDLGQSAIHKVFEGAKDFLAKHKPKMGGLMTGSGPVEAVFAKVAKALSKSKIATLALGMAGFAETRMRDLPGGHSSSSGSLQLLAETAAAFGIDPHDEAAVSSHFLLRGFYGRGGANKLAAAGLPAHLVAQNVQGSAFSDGSNYLAQEGAAKGWMKRFGLRAGGLIKNSASGGPISAVIRRLAAGGMVDVPGEGGTGVVAPSIVDLVSAYAKKFDSNIDYGYDPSGHVSPGHLSTGTATDVSPTDGNWTGKFEDGLRLLVSKGFEVGYGTDGIGEAWANHGRGNHAHIEWVGNGTAPDARQRLREYLGGVGTSSQGAASGSEAAPKEAIPRSYKGVKAGDQVNLGPMPKDLEGVKVAIKKWSQEVGKYRSAKAHAEKNGKPGVAQAIGRNLSAIERRISALRQQQTRLRLAGVRKALKKRLDTARGRFGDYDQILEGSQRSYDGAYQYAEQVVALEPQSPELPATATDTQREAAEKTHVANLTAYVDGPERNAFGEVLGKVADWRNNILKAETFGFGKGRPSVSASHDTWENEAFNVRNRIGVINDFTQQVARHLAKFREQGNKALPDWLKGQIATRDKLREQLPALQVRNSKLTEAVSQARELFFRGNRLNPLKPPAVPLPGSGTLEERLKDVQGIHWPDQHELLPAGALAPPRVAGRFGGAIWDVQTRIEELGLTIRQATNSLGSAGGSEDSGNSELKELEAQLNTDWRKRFMVSELQRGTIDLFNRTYPVGFPFAGTFHAGGVTPGPRTRESVALVRGEERIRTPEQELAMAETIRGLEPAGEGGAERQLIINGNIVQEAGDTRDPVEEVIGDRRFVVAVRQASMGGRVTSGGPRR